ncbi:MAG: hypothetical protein H7268_09735 [Sandarakinorhabdus sp.]|nr:hypothetical protein [Sandarakinorhabdus sp.]
MSKRSFTLPLVVVLAMTISACATKKKDLPPTPPMAMKPVETVTPPPMNNSVPPPADAPPIAPSVCRARPVAARGYRRRRFHALPSPAHRAWARRRAGCP